jgi:hypothetical protein
LFLDGSIFYKFTSNSDIASANNIIEILKSIIQELEQNDILNIVVKIKNYNLSIISKLEDVIANLNRLLELELIEEKRYINRLNTRRDILMLFEGTQYYDYEHSSNHISQYLLNDLVIKELCSYNMEFTDPIFEWGWEEKTIIIEPSIKGLDFSVNFHKLFPGDRAHKYFLENEV